MPQSPTSKPRVGAALKRHDAVADAKAQLEAADAIPDKQWQALTLRGVDRLSYHAIAGRLGVSVSQARRYVSEGLELLQQATREEAEEVRALELLALDEMQSVFTPLMRGGSPHAANVLIKVMIRRDRLMRLSSDNEEGGGDENDVVDWVPLTDVDVAGDDAALNAALEEAAEGEVDDA